MPGAAIAASNLARYEEARQYASECLAVADRYLGNWNYGNAVHDCNLALALLALYEVAHSRAKEELRRAAPTPDSSQFDSFGPSMQLAQATLARGYSEDVLVYLAQCRRFWKMGGAWLNVWEKQIRKSQTPNFMLQA